MSTTSTTSPTMTRTRHDRCPGVLRPWIADDGALVRLRLVGGRLPAESLRGLAGVAASYGDGDVHLTRRANLQLRALPHHDGALPGEVVTAIGATGLLPSRSHELVRNVMVSPATGLAGGLADLRPVAEELDRALCVVPDLAALPGRFLFVLDDGRGDLLDRSCDLGLVAVSPTSARLRVGSRRWGPVVPLDEAPGELAAAARHFLDVRGSGPSAPWHVDELPGTSYELVAVTTAPPDSPAATGPLPIGPGPAGEHVEVPDGRLTPALVERLAGAATELVVTPWHGVLVPRAREGGTS